MVEFNRSSEIVDSKYWNDRFKLYVSLKDNHLYHK